MKKFGQKLLLFVIGSLIIDGICFAVTNIMDGKDILGNKLDSEKTKVDMRGRIHLGTDDYLVE